MDTTARKMTYADYVKIPADGHRHEIIEGEWFMTPAPNLNHQGIVGNVHLTVGTHVVLHKLGRVFVAPTDVVLSEHDVVEPDIVFVSKDRLSILTEPNIQGAPDLVIEVLSPSTAALDRGRKLALYERAGVKECWLVDPSARVIEIHEMGSPRRTRIYKEGQTFESALLPGLILEVSAIFRPA